MSPKIFIDLTQHGSGYDSVDQQILFDELYPQIDYPRVDLYLSEGLSLQYSFFDYKAHTSEVKGFIFGLMKKSEKEREDELSHWPTRAKKDFDILAKTNAKELVHDGELYTQKQYETVQMLFRQCYSGFNRSFGIVEEGKVREAATIFNKSYSTLRQMTQMRDKILSSTLPQYMKQKKYSSAYLHFGSNHLGLLNCFPNASVRFIIHDCSRYFLTEGLSGNTLPLFLYQTLVNYATASENHFRKITDQYFDVLLSFNKSEQEQILKELDEKLLRIARLSGVVMEIDVTAALEDVIKPKLLAKNYDRIVPEEWGGTGQVVLRPLTVSGKNF